MNISGLDKALVLAALYNNAKIQGKSALDLVGDVPMENAQNYLETRSPDLDCLNGRKMKIDLSFDEVDTSRYNYYNGEDAAEQAVDSIR